MPNDDAGRQGKLPESSPIFVTPIQLKVVQPADAKTCPACGGTGESTFAPGSKCTCGAADE